MQSKSIPIIICHDLTGPFEAPSVSTLCLKIGILVSQELSYSSFGEVIS